MTHLHSYLTTQKVSQARLAELVGVSRAYMSELVGGTKTPSLSVAAAIERATRGKVKAVSWVKDEARQ